MSHARYPGHMETGPRTSHARVMVVLAILAGHLALSLAACDSAVTDADHSSYSYIQLKLTSEGAGSIDDSVVVTSRYTINYPPDEWSTGRWVARGHFLAWSSDWTIVSGDSSWVDSLMSFETRVHSILVVPRVKGTPFIRAYVEAPLDKLPPENQTRISEWAFLMIPIK